MNHETMNMVHGHETMKQDAMDATQQHSYYFHHQCIKSISLAVLALFTFWWWYHSFWLGRFLADGNNPIKHHLDHSITNSHKVEVLENRCKTSESVESAKKKITYQSNAKSTSCVIHRNCQEREKQMYLDER